jgi:hypothetical protein
MSDISLPPNAPKPAGKKASSGVRTLLMLAALAAPLPVAITAADLWLQYAAAAQNVKETPFGLIRQIINETGEPQYWLLPVSLLPSLVMLLVLGRTLATRVFAVIALLFFAAGAFMLVGQLGEGFIR